MFAPIRLIAVGALGLALLTSQNAQAVLITPTTQTQWTLTEAELAALGNPPGNIDATKLMDFLNGSPVPAYDLGGVILESLYKQDVGGPEEGDFADDYSTDFDPDVEPDDATITWNGGQSDIISFEHMFVVVKDGKADPKLYIFDLSNLTIGGNPYSWNGTDPLELDGFWEGVNGAISHVEIYGGEDRDDSDLPGLPEPTSIAAWLIGAGAFSLILRRRVKKDAA